MARAILIVLDGLGVGGAPDAEAYGDAGSDTLANMAAAVGGLRVPNLAALGLGNLHAIAGVAPAPNPRAGYGATCTRSPALPRRRTPGQGTGGSWRSRRARIRPPATGN